MLSLIAHESNIRLISMHAESAMTHVLTFDVDNVSVGSG